MIEDSTNESLSDESVIPFAAIIGLVNDPKKSKTLKMLFRNYQGPLTIIRYYTTIKCGKFSTPDPDPHSMLLKLFNSVSIQNLELRFCCPCHLD